jgi:hypothetical protein
MMLEGRIFYSTSAATIRQILEVVLKEIYYKRDKGKERKGYRIKI